MAYGLASDSLIRETETESVHKAAWLRSSRFRGSGRWLMSASDRTTDPCVKFSDDEYRVALRWRFLASPFADLPAAPNGLRCTACPAVFDPSDPFHFMNCTSTGLHSIRHAEIQRILAEFITIEKKDALITTSPLYHDAITGEELTSKADLQVTIPHRVTKYLDLCIVNPASDSYTAPPYRAHRNDLAAAKAWEDRKLREAQNSREVREQHLVPFVIESTGRLGERAIAYVHDLTDYYPDMADKRMLPPSDRLQTKLSTAITRLQAWFATRYHASLRLGHNNEDAAGEEFHL